MRHFIAAMLMLALVIAGCAKPAVIAPEEQLTEPEPVVVIQESVAVPEIAQAEQSVDEIGMQEFDEMEKDSDELVLP